METYKKIKIQEDYINKIYPDKTYRSHPNISLTFLELPNQEYQQYKLLSKYHGKFFKKPLTTNANQHRPTIDVLNDQEKLYQAKGTPVVVKQYQRDKNLQKNLQLILDQRDLEAQEIEDISIEEHKNYYLLTDNDNKLSFYQVKDTPHKN